MDDIDDFIQDNMSQDQVLDEQQGILDSLHTEGKQGLLLGKRLYIDDQEQPSTTQKAGAKI